MREQHLPEVEKAPLLARKWKVAIVLFFTAALNYADRSAVSSVYPLLRSDLHLSAYALAGVGTIFLWSYAFGSPFGGLLGDYERRSRVLVLSLVCWSLVMMLTALSRSAHTLLFFRGLLGLAECAYLPSAYALLADHHDRTTRATALGLHICGVNVGIVGGSTLAAAMGQRFGWRSDFVILGALGLCFAVVCSLVVTEGPLRLQRTTQKQSMFQNIGSLLAKPVYLWVAASAMLVGVVTWSLLNWLPLFFHDHFQMGLTASGFASAGSLQIAAILGSFSGGLISDRAARSYLGRRIAVLACTRFVASPLLLLFLLPLSAGITCVAVFAYAVTIALGSASEVATICESVDEQQQATALGMFNLANSVAGGVGILGTVYLHTRFGWRVAFASLTVCVLIAACCLVMAWRTQSKAGTGREEVALDSAY